MVCAQVLGFILAAQNLGPTWGQSIPTSPCPDVFQYQVDSSGNWYGHISIPAPQPGYTFRTSVELAIDAVLPTQYVGALKLLENENEVWRRINLGDRRPIQFHLYFPLSWPLPLVRSITSNENVICIGNTPNKILTKVSLEHILYPIRGPAFLRQNYNANHLSNGMNSYQYVEYAAKNDSFYGVKAPTELAHSFKAIQVYHEDAPS